MSNDNDTTTEQSKTVAARVYVPEAVSDTVHEDVKKKLAHHFGGYSAFTAEGGWVADDGSLIEDTTTVYESLTDDENAFEVVKTSAQWVKQESSEDAVLWEVRPVSSHGFE